MSGGATVLMTADAVGGVWHYALGLCAAMPEFRFVLAVMGPPPNPAQVEAAARLGNVVIKAKPYRLEWMKGADEDMAASCAWLGMLARLHGAELLHVNGYAHAAIGAGLPVLVVTHSDVLSWWQAVHGDAAPAEWLPYRRAVAAGLAAADRLVAPTGAALAQLHRYFPLGRTPASVIPNGIDLASFAPREKRPVVMAAGRLWDRAKNMALLDEIAGGLAWPVEIAGETSHPERGGTPTLPSPASGGGSGWGQCGARFLGPLSHDEMARRLGEAAIFAAPALYEPFGLAVAEAAAAGCALALTDIPSLRENWDGAALFAPPADHAAWRSMLSCLIACDERRRALAAAAHERAQRLSLQESARLYAALYRDLIGARAAA